MLIFLLSKDASFFRVILLLEKGKVNYLEITLLSQDSDVPQLFRGENTNPVENEKE